MKQSFKITRKDGKVLGCSFRRANYFSLYFGWVTLYDSEEEYQNATHWTERKNIPLTNDKDSSRTKLERFCKEEI